jgi:ribonucleoside-diphosphate reductase alpha chain
VDFLKAYSAALGQILQGAKRQGANIAILNADHPDIEDFIKLKTEDGTIKNFNISVGVTGEFMEAVAGNKEWELKNPRNGEVWRTVKAKQLFEMIAEYAWKTGDPGLAFLDRLEEDNPTPSLGKLEATNPCITGDALVPTAEGLIRLDRLVETFDNSKELRILVDERLNKKDTTQVKALSGAVKTGIKPVFELRTVHGYGLRATGDHRIMTTDGWKAVADIGK